jgi:hypothetical protein
MYRKKRTSIFSCTEHEVFKQSIPKYLLVAGWETQLVLQEHFLQTTFHYNKNTSLVLNAFLFMFIYMEKELLNTFL